MKNVSDSLAGRLGIIKLFGLSQREKYKLNFYDEFCPTEDYIEKHKKLDLSYDDVWNEILRGGSPELFANKDYNQKVFWQNYISEYLDRDVISEILKSFYNALNTEPRLYFYRGKDMKEIDLIIVKNMTLYPIEIKKHADPSKDDIKNFSVLNKFTNVRIGEGAIISFYDKPIHITDNVMNIPISYI